ncbi:Coiled-coil domain-containing protein 17 [Clydaea vesicula]|uniref:Coiled-coil domain-containing protein 17 n=1 Tax=Clydaea vesicula TaxID=447962 RepID=A0AAD5U020_9FUNG|nr:Coiled-coil domain-containing protein 17 [Clydaea vesicula]
MFTYTCGKCKLGFKNELEFQNHKKSFCREVTNNEKIGTSHIIKKLLRDSINSLDTSNNSLDNTELHFSSRLDNSRKNRLNSLLNSQNSSTNLQEPNYFNNSGFGQKPRNSDFYNTKLENTSNTFNNHLRASLSRSLNEIPNQSDSKINNFQYNRTLNSKSQLSTGSSSTQVSNAHSQHKHQLNNSYNQRLLNEKIKINFDSSVANLNTSNAVKSNFQNQLMNLFDSSIQPHNQSIKNLELSSKLNSSKISSQYHNSFRDEILKASNRNVVSDSKSRHSLKLKNKVADQYEFYENSNNENESSCNTSRNKLRNENSIRMRAENGLVDEVELQFLQQRTSEYQNTDKGVFNKSTATPMRNLNDNEEKILYGSANTAVNNSKSQKRIRFENVSSQNPNESFITSSNEVRNLETAVENPNLAKSSTNSVFNIILNKSSTNEDSVNIFHRKPLVDMKALLREKINIEKELELIRSQRSFNALGKKEFYSEDNGLDCSRYDSKNELLNLADNQILEDDSLSSSKVESVEQTEIQEPISKKKRVSIEQNILNEEGLSDADPTQRTIAEEIRLLRLGGNNPTILAQIRSLEQEAVTLKVELKHLYNNNEITSPVFLGLKEETNASDFELVELKNNHARIMLKLAQEKEKIVFENELLKELGLIKPEPVPPPSPLPIADEESFKKQESVEKFHLKKEKKLTPGEFDQLAIPVYSYDQNRGFSICWDFLSGLPFYVAGKGIQLIYAHFDGAQPRGEATQLKTQSAVGDNASYVIRTIFDETSDFVQIPAKITNRIVIEFQVVTNDTNCQSQTVTDFEPLGWTSLDLFNSNLELDAGRWCLPIFPPPINFTISTQKLMATGDYEYEDLMTKEFLENEKANSLWEMDQVRKKLEERPPTPPPVKIPTPEPEPVPDLTPKFLNTTFGLQIDSISNMPLTPYPNVLCEIVGMTRNSYFETVLKTFTTADAEAIDGNGTYAWADAPQILMVDDLAITDKTFINFKIQIQESHIAKHVAINACSENLQYFTKTSGFREVKIINPTNKETITLKVYIFRGRKSPVWAPFLPKLIYQPMLKDAWIKTDNVIKNENDFVKGEGFTVYVDFGRFFPANSSCTKITARIFNVKGKQLKNVDNVEAFIDINSDVFFPTYGIYTVCIFTGTLRLIGSTGLNIFVDRHTKSQPTQKNTSFYLNEALGGHQLNIFYDTPEVQSDFSVECFKPLSRVPCASILVRIVKLGVGVNESTALIPTPKYNDHMYSTRLYNPPAYETVLFSYINAERSPPTKEEIMDWINFHLTKPANGVVQNNDLEYTFKYDSRAGFKICCDRGERMDVPGFNFLNQTVLNGTKNGRSFGESYLYTKLDVKNSFLNTPFWSDGFQWYRGIKFTPRSFDNSVVLFEVIVIKDSNVSFQGWTVAAIFNEQGYVRFGSYQLPLFENRPVESVINQLKENALEKVIENALSNKVIKLCKKNSSIFVRICDSRREFELKKENIDKSYLPADKNKKYEKDKKTNKLVIPFEQDEKEYIRQIVPQVRNSLK